MATSSWGYPTASLLETTINIPEVDFGRFVKDASASKNNKAVYNNMACPPNQQERLTLKTQKVSKITSAAKPAYPHVTNKGYSIVIIDDQILRVKQDDDSYNDEFVSVQVDLRATDGSYAPGGIQSGADWAEALERMGAFLFTIEENTTADGTTYRLRANQELLDRLMFGNLDLVDQQSTL